MSEPTDEDDQPFELVITVTLGGNSATWRYTRPKQILKKGLKRWLAL